LGIEVRKLNPQAAIDLMIKAGVMPIEEYPGSAKHWKCKCLKCGAIVWPQHSSIKQNPGSGGCNPCAKVQTQVVLRKRNFENALKFLSTNDLVLLGPYKSAKTRCLFRCKRCGKEFFASYTDFTSNGRTCTCKKLPRNPIGARYPQLAKELHPTANGLLTPEHVGTGKRSKVWWLCPNQHQYEATPANRVSGSSCRYCLGMEAYVGESDLSTLYPELCKDLATAEDRSRARLLRPGSNEILSWRCQKNKKHVYPMSPYDRTTSGSGCSYCAGKRVMTGDNDFLSKYPEQSLEWDYDSNFPQRPETVHSGSNERFAWICSFNPAHKWVATPNNRQRSGCLKCSHFKPGRNDLQTMALKASRPELVREWDSVRNNRTAAEVAYASNDIFHWVCSKFPENHSFTSKVSNRWFGESGCPTCSPSAYDATSPGVLYFIENTSLSARKIGITNRDAKTKRIQKFVNIGWKLIFKLEDDDGYLIRGVEQNLLRMIRDEHELPQFLEKTDMRGMGGSTETFSSEGVKSEDLLIQIQFEYEKLKSRINNSKLDKLKLD